MRGPLGSPGNRSSVLIRIPVVVTGDWDQTTGKWRGVARGSEALVSVVLLTARGETDWCKSGRATGPEIVLTLSLFPFEDPGVVEVNVTAGGSGRRVATRVPSATYRPALQHEVTVNT